MPLHFYGTFYFVKFNINFNRGGSVSSGLRNNKNNTLALFFYCAGILASTILYGAEGPSALQIVDGFYPAYPQTAPAEGERAELISKGEYLAKMGDCIACHTNVKAGTAPFAGGLPLVTPFGTFYSPNITPDPKTGIGTWTEQDFIRAMKQGKDPHGRNYFPVFPYLYFSKTTDDDARALYAYFMSIPPVMQENKTLPFPFNVPGVRTTLFGWNLLFFFADNEDFKTDASHSSTWNRGKYIVDSLGHCGMCHTPLNTLGAPKKRYYLTGGFVDGYWAPNIGHDGLQSATVDDIVNVFKKDQLINHAGTVAGPMAEVNHDSMKYMTDEDLRAVATYLKTVKSDEPNGLSPSFAQPTLSRGKQVYFKACVLCHQDGIMGAPVIGDPANWYRRVQESGLEKLYQHAINGFNSMPVKGACVTCSDNDIIAASQYILQHSLTRSQWLETRNTANDAQDKSHKLKSGQKVYEENCSACHTDGQHNAPKIGDKEQWSTRASQNLDVLLEHAMNSQSHPKNGGCASCSTTEIKRAIKYMLRQSDVKGNYQLW